MRMATLNNGTERNFDINAISSCLQVCLATTLQSLGEHSTNSRKASSVQSGR